MYSEKVTSQKLDQVARHLKRDLTYHSVAQVDSINKHFESITEFNDKGEAKGWRRELDQGELDWIINERILCKYDFNYWVTRYAFIINLAKEIVRFKPNIAQQVLIQMWGESEALLWAIMLLELKARQLGVTLVNLLAILQRVLFYTATDAIAASSEPKRSREMADKVESILKYIPWWLKPERTASRSVELIEFGKLDSKLNILWGNQKQDTGRSSTPNVAHLSELPDWENPKEKIDAGLLNAVHESPSVFIVLESTGKGKGNWWHKKWMDAKEMWPERRSRLRPVFLPWYVGRDLYPMPTWLEMHPVPQGWQPKDLTIQHARKAKEFVRDFDLLRKHMGQGWEMPTEQMWFYEWSFDDAERNDKLTEFFQERPSDDQEAFQVPHSNVFSAKLIYEIKSQQKDPVGVYAIAGPEDEISPHAHPYTDEIDENKPPIILTPRWNSSLEPVVYRLIPLKFQGYSNASPVGRLYVWEFPQDGREYGLGIDPSYGRGQDLAALEVLRNRTHTEPYIQAAEFVSPLLNAKRLWPYALIVLDFYSVLIEGVRRQARAAIEMAANGEWVQSELKDRGWWNFHQRISLENKVIDFSHAHQIGFSTNRKTRPKVTGGLETSIKEYEIIINSPWLLEDDVAGIVWNPDKERLEASYGSKDDRFMATGIIRESFRQTESPGMRVAIHRQKEERRAEAEFYPTYNQGERAADVPSNWMKEHLEQNFIA